MNRTDMPNKSDWQMLRPLDFAVEKLFRVPDFMQKTEFRAKALRATNSKIDSEKYGGKKINSDIVPRPVIGEKMQPLHRSVEALPALRCGNVVKVS